MNSKNSTSYSNLNNEYKWYELILKGFNSNTDKNNPKKYIMHQYRLRNGAYELNYFLEKYKEFTTDLQNIYPTLCQKGFIVNHSYTPPEQAIYDWYTIMKVTPNSDKTTSYKFGFAKVGVLELLDFKSIIIAIDDLMSIEISKSKSKKKEISLNQIALKYIYENNSISDTDCKSIAEKYNFTSPNSGHKLKQNYNKLLKTIDRTGDPESKRILNSRISLIESVIPLLEKTSKIKAEKELEINFQLLKDNY